METIRRVLVVPRGTVKEHIGMAKKEGIGEIEERDGISEVFIKEEKIQVGEATLDFKTEWQKAITTTQKLSVIARRLELE